MQQDMPATGHGSGSIAPSGAFGRLAWHGLLRWCQIVGERRRQRIALAHLSDNLLKDIGITRDQARSEAARLPWW
jgi:uncharacterized protein YjiS (DUF1127 family)